MKEHPILFSAPMVRAILEGRKTQTRRVVAPQPTREFYCWSRPGMALFASEDEAIAGDEGDEIRCPYGTLSDRLWCKETWRLSAGPSHEPLYAADLSDYDRAEKGPWKPSIFMSRKLSRITLEIVEVRAQRLQEITAADACDEGALEVLDTGHPLRAECYAKHGTWAGDDRRDVDGPYAGAVAAFATLWDSINGKRRVAVPKPWPDTGTTSEVDTSASWSSNPWVWAITFRRVP